MGLNANEVDGIFGWFCGLEVLLTPVCFGSLSFFKTFRLLMHSLFSNIALQMISFGPSAHNSSFDGQYTGVIIGSLFSFCHFASSLCRTSSTSSNSIQIPAKYPYFCFMYRSCFCWFSSSNFVILPHISGSAFTNFRHLMYNLFLSSYSSLQL